MKNQFRQGNLVHHVILGTSEILEIRNDGISVCNPNNKMNAYFVPNDKLNRIEFISLTSEWLTKCKLDGKIWTFEIFGDDKRGFHISSESGEWIFIHYVHQLQNLYFALTGEELEVSA